MAKIKRFTVQFLDNDQKTKRGDLIEISAESKKQAIRKACKIAGFPYPSPYFSLVSEKNDPKPKQKQKQKIEPESN